MNVVSDFCIKVDFKKESEAPSRVFRVLSELIESFQEFDNDLVQSIDTKIEATTLLEDIEAGSVKTWLRQIVEAVEDDALKNLDWKPAIGKYLVKAKYLLVNFLQDKDQISDRKQLQQLGNDLLKIAQETDVKHIPAYTPLSQQKLISNLDRITKATSPLLEGDKLVYISGDLEAPFNLSFRIAPESIEDLITKESIESSLVMILKVKKPDYLGESMWEFKHAGRIVPAKIIDTEWLSSFQRREKDVRPGDSIRANVKIITKYDYDLNVISMKYTVIDIIEILPGNLSEQNPLF